ncbi:hypothetical protein AMTRI_Chr03g56430 [Amborella trichopoda]
MDFSDELNDLDSDNEEQLENLARNAISKLKHDGISSFSGGLTHKIVDKGSNLSDRVGEPAPCELIKYLNRKDVPSGSMSKTSHGQPKVRGVRFNTESEVRATAEKDIPGNVKEMASKSSMTHVQLEPAKLVSGLEMHFPGDGEFLLSMLTSGGLRSECVHTKGSSLASSCGNMSGKDATLDMNLLDTHLDLGYSQSRSEGFSGKYIAKDQNEKLRPRIRKPPISRPKKGAHIDCFEKPSHGNLRFSHSIPQLSSGEGANNDISSVPSSGNPSSSQNRSKSSRSNCSIENVSTSLSPGEQELVDTRSKVGSSNAAHICEDVPSNTKRKLPLWFKGGLEATSWGRCLKRYRGNEFSPQDSPRDIGVSDTMNKKKDDLSNGIEDDKGVFQKEDFPRNVKDVASRAKGKSPQVPSEFPKKVVGTNGDKVSSQKFMDFFMNEGSVQPDTSLGGADILEVAMKAGLTFPVPAWRRKSKEQ